jgi:hypothetical protein
VVKGIGACLLAVLLAGAVAVANAPPDKGWVPLFNGKDLSGWKNNGDEKWVVEQGTILCESTANKYGYLTTDKTYKDFNLRLKFKGEAAGNSGVFVHAQITGINPQHGPDIQGMHPVRAPCAALDARGHRLRSRSADRIFWVWLSRLWQDVHGGKTRRGRTFWHGQLVKSR